MAHPLRLTPTDVARLDDIQLVALLNRLLHLEAAALCVLPSDVDTTLRTKNRDGGVDARTTNVPLSSSLWLPSGMTVWQSKSGKVTGGDLKKECGKPGVQEALKSGGQYVIWLGADVEAGGPRTGLSGEAKSNSQRALRDIVEQCLGADGYPKERSRLYFAAQIAEWANQYPAVVLEYRPASLGALLSWPLWKGQRRYGQTFVGDDQRLAVIEGFRLRLSPRTPELRSLRIEGLAGVGKSRLALEIFQDSPLSDLMLYAAQPQDVPHTFWTYAAHNAVELILVVDECSLAEHQNLAAQAEGCEGRVRLLTVGQRYSNEATPTGSTDLVHLGQLEDQAMLDVLKGSFPLLPDDWARFVVDVSSGFVKLASILAEEMLKKNQPLSVTELMRSREVSLILDALVPDDMDRKVLGVIAVLRRVGWEGDRVEEGKLLCAHLGVDWHDARQRLTKIEATRGLVARQGNYRYVTPHLLGVWLAANVYEAFGPAHFMRIHSELLAPARREDFEQRVRDFGSDNRTKPLVEALLDIGGLFPDLPALEGPDTARFLRLLGEANPEEGLRTIERLIFTSSDENLKTFAAGRTQVIWMLLAIAWRDDLFDRAARVMLELAAHEDQTRRVGPHASHEWRGFFRIHLGGTAASMEQRLSLLALVMTDADHERRRLAVTALASIYSFHENRTHHSDTLAGAPLPVEWRPQTVIEAAAIRRQALGLLELGLSDIATDVRKAAIEILDDAARIAGRSGFADDYLALVERTEFTSFDERRKIRAALEETLEFEAKSLSPEQKLHFEALSQQLAGDSFHDRIQRYFGNRTPGDRVHFRLGFEEEQRLYLKQAEEIAAEVVSNPEVMNAEWEWLLSPAATNAYYFGWALGRSDAEQTWWVFLQNEARSHQRGFGIVAAYLRGQVEIGALERESVLDAWMLEGALMARVTFDVIWRGEFNDSDAERIATLIEKGWIEAASIGSFFMGSAFAKISVALARHLIGLALDAGNDEATDAAISLLHLRMERTREGRELFTDLAWRSLELPGGLWRVRRDSMADYNAVEIGKMLVPLDPARIAKAVLTVYESDDAPVGHAEILDVLSDAARIGPNVVWDLVAAKLFPTDEGSYMRAYKLRLALEKWFVSLIPSATLLNWAERMVPEGPMHIAALADVGGYPMNDLAYGLLSRFGDNETVRSELFGQFISGGWWGPMSEWFRAKLNLTEKWALDANPGVRSWAIYVGSYLREQIAQAELDEVERGF